MYPDFQDQRQKDASFYIHYIQNIDYVDSYEPCKEEIVVTQCYIGLACLKKHDIFETVDDLSMC